MWQNYLSSSFEYLDSRFHLSVNTSADIYRHRNCRLQNDQSQCIVHVGNRRYQHGRLLKNNCVIVLQKSTHHNTTGFIFTCNSDHILFSVIFQCNVDYLFHMFWEWLYIYSYYLFTSSSHVERGSCPYIWTGIDFLAKH